ncbi:MAG: hypothetical protein P4L39_04455 [Humidesulfovibrio sp.]|nr:hypothetical protein [Humidesulfovibrio sp.]
MVKASEAKRWIYAQGDLDGACFLYSIVNAFIALTHGELGFASICKAFGQVDFPGDFLNGEVGTTGHYDGNYDMLRDNMQRVLAALGEARFQVSRIAGAFALSDVASKVGHDSVVVVRYKGDSKYAQNVDHWVCAVDCDPSRQLLHVACSIRLLKACGGASCHYAEHHCARYERWSNDILSAAYPHVLVEGEAFQVSLPV